MHIIIASCVFPPEPVVSARTSFQIAEELVKQGIYVTVLTSFPNRPSGKLFPGYTRRLFQSSQTGKMTTIRCLTTFSQKSSLLSRFLENFTFGITSGFALLFLNKPDVIYSNSWPIFATGILILLAKIRKIPVALSIQDIYPESLSSQGRTRFVSLIIKALHFIDSWIACQSQAVIVISKRFADIYREDRKVPDNRLFIVPNWGSEKINFHVERDETIRAKYSISLTDFLIVYGGNIGVAAGVEAIVKEMESLPPTIKLLIAGEGSQLKSCQDLAEKMTRGRVIFHTPWPMDETEIVLGAADLCLLPTRGNQTSASVPSKLISYMLAARPVLGLANLDTEITETILQSGCGWVIEPEKLEQFTGIINKIHKLPSQDLIRRGQAGRNYAIKHFSRETNIKQITNILFNITTR